ncbi:uncharacterized protein LOC125895321 [Epinephelus fuscoguttatus]|uniref:uncharacterized protein LOC125895321 n=1 Tax=Epinephelus fuscoguttatus TaxID=293821 RepID=UPI0020D0CCE0|nr:uncharacterized protein LOC125895321 [Epinephelus fuscoguttatus]
MPANVRRHHAEFHSRPLSGTGPWHTQWLQDAHLELITSSPLSSNTPALLLFFARSLQFPARNHPAPAQPLPPRIRSSPGSPHRDWIRSSPGSPHRYPPCAITIPPPHASAPLPSPGPSTASPPGSPPRFPLLALSLLLPFQPTIPSQNKPVFVAQLWVCVLVLHTPPG